MEVSEKMDFSDDMNKEKTDKTRNQFITSISCEIQPLLNTIIELSETLLKSNLSNEQKSNVENIKNSGISINNFLKDMLETCNTETKTSASHKKNIIDVNKGMIFFSDSTDEYFNILKAVCNDGERQLETMKNCLEKQDFKGYMNEIYSLKSISANIGSESLSKILKVNESAYNRHDYDFIVNNFSMLADAYENVLKEIKNILCSEKNFTEHQKFNRYSNTGISLMKTAEFIDDFEVQSAKSELENLLESNETDWIKKQVIKRAISMLNNCCYQDTKNLVIAMAEGEKF